MNPVAFIASVSLFFLIGQILCLEAGYHLGRKRIGQEGEKAHAGLGATEAAVFSLLGLILAFTFSGAQARFDNLLHVTVEEANAIGSAYLRVDLMPAADQPAMRALLRQYADSRIIALNDLTEGAAASGNAAAGNATTATHLADSVRLQEQIWKHAEGACRNYQQHPCSMLVMPALNEMIDMSATHNAALGTHLPGVVLFLLSSLALAGALLAGYAMATRGRRSVPQMLLFSLTVSLTVYTVLDLEYPRVGLVRIHSAEHVMQEVRDSMK